MSSAKLLKYCVNNQWKDSKTEKYMPIFNSSTGELMSEAPCCTVDEVNEAISAAKSAFSTWSRTPVRKRTELMFKYKKVLQDHLDELALILSMENGKTLAEAKGEIGNVLGVVEMACGTPMMMQGDCLMQVSRGIDTILYREPIGVFAGIAPYNFPAMIPFGWMLPLCITTGNTFVLKAASQVPQTGIRIVELLIEAGMPEGIVNLVTCSRKEAEIVLTHSDVRGISYVGSTGVGKHIYSVAAAHGKRVQALCEAKNHGLVMRDANIKKSVEAILSSSFGTAGQRCMALSTLVVEEAIAEEFVLYLVEKAQKLKIGCAYEPGTQLGPVISADHKAFVTNWINKGIEEGAELVLDGRNVSVPGFEDGYYVGPTILDKIRPGMSVGDCEIFGPVLCIKRVKDFEEGLAIANANQFANGSVIFTESGYYAREFAYRTHGGMVGINVGIPVPVSFFSFTGHKNSFFGDLHVMGRDGIAFYTESKTVTSRWFGHGEKKQEEASEW